MGIRLSVHRYLLRVCYQFRFEPLRTRPGAGYYGPQWALFQFTLFQLTEFQFTEFQFTLFQLTLFQLTLPQVTGSVPLHSNWLATRPVLADCVVLPVTTAYTSRYG